jgi:glycosyltransferase involved in cell wall biosynthesis
MLVSIVIPAYNEAHRLPASFPRLIDAIQDLEHTEVILVDDGSNDGTADVAARYLRRLPAGHLLRLPWNAGKGAAVRAGVSIARGSSIVFMDADMASDLGDLPALLAALQHAEIALGSRRLGTDVSRKTGRRAGSWAFNMLTRSVAALDLADTQCGFKAFRYAEAKLLFAMSRATGFGFDVEVLSLARSLGYRIAEVPVGWSEQDGGRFNTVRHTPGMIMDVVRARRGRRRERRWAGRPLEPAAPPVAANEAGRLDSRTAGVVDLRPHEPGETAHTALRSGRDTLARPQEAV